MSDINKYIFAIGGGGFTHRKDKSLDNFILSIKNKEILKIGFLPTASKDNYEKTELFYESFQKTTHTRSLTLMMTWSHSRHETLSSARRLT